MSRLFRDILLIAFVAVVAILAVPYLAGMQRGQKVSLSNPHVSDILSNENLFVGRNVTVKGAVNDRVAQRAVIVNQEVNGKTTQILVISKQPLEAVGGGSDATLYDPGREIKVVGEVRRLNRAEIEHELDTNLDAPIIRLWEGKPVIIANFVDQLPQ